MKKLLTLTALLLTGLFINAQVEPLINNNWQTFMWPYNAYYPESQNGPNGHLGNACGYTSLARICHYWEYPVNGNGVLDFDDYFGNHWYIDLENMNLNYGDMHYELQWEDPEPVYHETATLMLACGAIGEDIQIGFTDGIFRIPEAMQDYMNYSEEMEVLQRWDYTREEWINIFKNELNNGRPIIIDGRTPDSPAPWEPGSWEGHFFVCDGYTEDDEFHMNYMFGGISGYYDIDNMGDFSAYHRIIINFEPFNVGLEEKTLQSDITIYPNPAKDAFTLVTRGNSTVRTAYLTNSGGSVVKSFHNVLMLEDQKMEIRTDDLAPGLYFLKVVTQHSSMIKKVLVVR